IEPLEHLFEVVAVERVWAQVGVLEKDLFRVAVGQAVELRPSAYPREKFRAAVQVVGPHLGPGTHPNAVWAEVNNPPGQAPRLLPGMTGQARVLVPGPDRGVAVPGAAIIDDGAETFVLIEEAAGADGAQFLKRHVEPIRREGDWVQLRPGGLY